MHPKTAIVLGATGLVGGHLLDQLAKDDRYGKIILFSRKNVRFEHNKIQEYRCDMFDLESQVALFRADEVYCCIGTTKAKTSDKETYKQIDYVIPLAAARCCRQNNIPTFIGISALGASTESPFAYSRIKGEMERAVLALDLPKTHFVQPALIGGKRAEWRTGEVIFKKLFWLLDPLLLGPLRKYRMIPPHVIASVMIWLANTPYSKKRVPSHLIKQL